jgi:hypothetical protein
MGVPHQHALELLDFCQSMNVADGARRSGVNPCIAESDSHWPRGGACRLLVIGLSARLVPILEQSVPCTVLPGQANVTGGVIGVLAGIGGAPWHLSLLLQSRRPHVIDFWCRCIPGICPCGIRSV